MPVSAPAALWSSLSPSRHATKSTSTLEKASGVRWRGLCSHHEALPQAATPSSSRITSASPASPWSKRASTSSGRTAIPSLKLSGSNSTTAAVPREAKLDDDATAAEEDEDLAEGGAGLAPATRGCVEAGGKIRCTLRRWRTRCSAASSSPARTASAYERHPSRCRSSSWLTFPCLRRCSRRFKRFRCASTRRRTRLSAELRASLEESLWNFFALGPWLLDGRFGMFTSSRTTAIDVTSYERRTRDLSRSSLVKK
mmetsp:Transcript_42768/g.84281  ORF Transcript_42768/g.84281 Transcript_42768/m.84281 type:complete len:255 (-) Transcript_42768:10-774(-)